MLCPNRRRVDIDPFTKQSATRIIGPGTPPMIRVLFDGSNLMGFI
jgi:hypothetical protein